MKKGEIYEGTVETVLFPNKGILQIDDSRVVVKNALPGQRIRFSISKKKNGRAEGRLLEVLEASPLETAEAGCSNYPQCGGCLYRSLPYEEQLKMKEMQVKRILLPVLFPEGDSTERDGSQEEAWSRIYAGIRPSPCEKAYRNKMEYSFGNAEKDGPITLGLHKRGSMYDVLSTMDCVIVHEDFNHIVRFVQEFARESGLAHFHKRTHTGYFRHLLVRRAAKTGEILIVLVTTSQYDAGEMHEKKLLSELVSGLLSLSLEGRVTGVLHAVNDGVADIVKAERMELLYGQDHFYEELLGLRFKITPFSFFQTNSLGAEVLYDTARSFLGEAKEKTIYDLYSGTGTIAQILAPAARETIGVEIVEEAVEAARENAMQNGLTNCTFLAGDVLRVLDALKDSPEIIVLDPPRDGIHVKALPKITAYGAETILYISCKPTSLARDLPHFLESGYEVKRIQCVDMFPGTVHVETVILLCRAEC